MHKPSLRTRQFAAAPDVRPPSLAVVARSFTAERTTPRTPGTLRLIRSPRTSPRAQVQTAAGVAYICDPMNHCIDVVAADGRPMFSFGGYGSRTGQFQTPAWVAIVQLRSNAWGSEPSAHELLVVADRGNHRIQLFELDGAFAGVVGGPQVRPAVSGWSPRAAWPYFRVGSVPNVRFPSHLDWHDPFLTIACGDGSTVRLDLAAALLPDLETWLHDAPLPQIQRAARRFCAGTDHIHIPAADLLRVIESLEPDVDDDDVAAWLIAE